MNINGRYYSKEALIGYHWHRTSCLMRDYLCVDLINGKTIYILYEDGVGERYNEELCKNIINFIKGEDKE